MEGAGCRKLSWDTRNQSAGMTGILHKLLVTPWHGWMHLSECLEPNLYKQLLMLCICIYVHISANVFWFPSSISQLTPLWTLPPPVPCLLRPQLVPFSLPTTYNLLLSLLPTSLIIFSFLLKISLLVHDPFTYLNIRIHYIHMHM